ncbi:unnamed protein product [Phaeothamnion confervicola]
MQPQVERRSQRLHHPVTLVDRAVNFAPEVYRREAISFEDEEDLRRLGNVVGAAAHIRFHQNRGLRGHVAADGDHQMMVVESAIISFEETAVTSRLVVKLFVRSNVPLPDASAFTDASFMSAPYAWVSRQAMWQYDAGDDDGGRLDLMDMDGIAVRPTRVPVRVVLVGLDRECRDRYTVWFYDVAAGEASFSEAVRDGWPDRINSFMQRQSSVDPAETFTVLCREPGRVFQSHVLRYG